MRTSALPILVPAFVAVPLLGGGVVRKVRARAQGRRGPPVLQNLFDLQRMLRKQPVDGPSSGFFAEVSPTLALLSAVGTWSVVLFGWAPLLLAIFLLVVQYVATLGFAMETGTSFGGLGASREVLLSVLAKPGLLLAMMLAQSRLPRLGLVEGALLELLLLGATAAALLAELARPPFDDPRTHLELTMVHEAMLLEASGRSLGLFELANQVKLAALLCLPVRMLLGHAQSLTGRALPGLVEGAVLVGLTLGAAALLGYWEAVSVRRKWSWSPELLGGALLLLVLVASLLVLLPEAA